MITVKVTPDDGRMYELTADSRDIYTWERTTKGASFAKLMSDMHMTDVYKVAHIAAQRQGQFDGTLADFADTHALDMIDEDEQGADEDEQGPTRSAASDEP